MFVGNIWICSPGIDEISVMLDISTTSKSSRFRATELRCHLFSILRGGLATKIMKVSTKVNNLLEQML